MVRMRSLVREKNRARKLTMFGAALLVSFLSVAYFCGLPGPVGGSADTTRTTASQTTTATTAPSRNTGTPSSTDTDPPFERDDLIGTYEYGGLSESFDSDNTVCGQRLWYGWNDGGFGYRVYGKSLDSGYCAVVLIGSFSNSTMLGIYKQSDIRARPLHSIVSSRLRTSNLAATIDGTVCPLYDFSSGDNTPIAALASTTCYLSHSGNSIVVSDISCRAGYFYDRSSNTCELPTVNLVGLEVTQGAQNWAGTLDLVRNRKTVVRAFFETLTADEQVKVTATLRGHTSSGTDLGSRNPINPGRSVTVSTNVVEAKHRSNINSSLNFVLPLDWTNLGENETLFLSLDFPDNVSVNCQERLVPMETCSANVSFTEVAPPNIVMVPVPIILDGDTEPTTPDILDLLSQFRRIQSIMPFPFQHILTPESISFETLNFIDDFGPFNQTTEDIGDLEDWSVIDLMMVNARLIEFLEDAEIDVNETPTKFLGVLLGESASRLIGVAPGLNSDVASWYTEGINERGEEYFGQDRNVGSHELGHTLGQLHPGRHPGGDESLPLEGVCSEGATGGDIEYEYFGDPNPNNDIAELVALLGPLGDVDTEVWGLDTYFADRRQFPRWQDNLYGLIVSDPREVYSVMSYCMGNSRTQALWMDAFHHERIIRMFSGASGVSTAEAVGDSGQGSKKPSDIFSGTIVLSPEGVETGASVNRIYSRPRIAKTPESGDYVLELLDISGNTMRSIVFEATQPIANIIPNGDEDLTEEPGFASFALTVTDPPYYSSFAITKLGREIAAFSRSSNAPTVSIEGPREGQNFDNNDTISLSWTGSDADNDDLTYRLYYSTDAGLAYRPLSLETSSTSKVFAASKLKGSRSARIGISVSDGTRSSFAETPIFSVSGSAPDVWIEAPMSGTGFSENQDFVLDSTSYDLEDGLLPFTSYNWKSDLDGNLGIGRYIVLSAADLTSGKHNITVTATDSSGMTADASVGIVINLRNTLPEANDDIISVAPDTEVLLDVLGNDMDLERDVDISSFRIIHHPTLGFAQIHRSQNGYYSIKYFSNTSGRDSLQYVICDAVSRCDAAEVNIDVGLADCTILGTEGDDVIEGTSGDDVICGLGGDDTIDAGGGDDVIRGGFGDDTIYARAGNDIIYGEIGNDFILGHNGADTIYGGLDDDIIYGGGDADRIFGGHGQDRLYGEADNDTIDGGDGSDTIHGGRGDDTIRGGDGDDTIRGNTGADAIEPGKGTNTLLGVSPEDTITEIT